MAAPVAKDLLVGKGGPDGSPSSPNAMESKDLLVGEGGPDGSSRYAQYPPEQ